MKKKLLEIINLSVELNKKIILKDINLTINEGENHIIFGPNGGGKTTLLSVIMGLSPFKIVSGKIIFKEEEINNLEIHKKSQLGIGMCFQNPPSINGVEFKNLLNQIIKNKKSEKELESEKIEKIINKLSFEKFLNREVNVGFSGGEKKRSEIIQLLCQNPTLCLFDEIESGVDLENIRKISALLFDFFKEQDSYSKENKNYQKSAIFVSHHNSIMENINIETGHVLIDGKLIFSGNAKEIFDQIKTNGFKKF
jgi:Fe-S cluster assembly ATP-binding protein